MMMLLVPQVHSVSPWLWYRSLSLCVSGALSCPQHHPWCQPPCNDYLLRGGGLSPPPAPRGGGRWEPRPEMVMGPGGVGEAAGVLLALEGACDQSDGATQEQ